MFAFKNVFRLFRRMQSLVPVTKLSSSGLASRKNDGFELIYDLSYARVGSVVNSIKLKQSILSGAALPLTATLEAQSAVPTATTGIVLAIAVCSNIAFYSIGHLFYKLIGKVYLNQKRNIVKLSYVGFFGSRVDLELSKDEVEGLGDEQPGYLYTKVYLDSEEKFLKLQEKYYDYCDVALARHVFGESFKR